MGAVNGNGKGDHGRTDVQNNGGHERKRSAVHFRLGDFK